MSTVPGGSKNASQQEMDKSKEGCGVHPHQLRCLFRCDQTTAVGFSGVKDPQPARPLLRGSTCDHILPHHDPEPDAFAIACCLAATTLEQWSFKWMHRNFSLRCQKGTVHTPRSVNLRSGAFQGFSVSAGTAGVLVAVGLLARPQCHSQLQASTILVRTTAAADTKRSGASRRMATRS